MWSTILWVCALSRRVRSPLPRRTRCSVLPACIVGSGLAGALSMAFGCTLPAPHGGVFVFPVMTNVLGYLIALAAGSAGGHAAAGPAEKEEVLIHRFRYLNIVWR